MLSALVVKGSFFIVVRLWFDVMPGLPGPAAAQLLAALGAAAIVFGSVVALRQERLKLLIAYSTLAQIGYLFLMFPLAFEPGSARLRERRRPGRRHAAGDVARHREGRHVHGGGTDLRGAGARSDRRARRHRAGAADERPRLRAGRRGADRPAAERRLSREGAAAPGGGRDRAMVVGGRDPGGRDLHEQLPVLVLAHALAPADEPVSAARVAVPRSQEAAALALALCSLVLGLVPWEAYLPVPRGSLSKPLALETLCEGRCGRSWRAPCWRSCWGAGALGWRASLRKRSSSRWSVRPGARPLPWAG